MVKVDAKGAMINQWQASRIGVLLDQEVWALGPGFSGGGATIQTGFQVEHPFPKSPDSLLITRSHDLWRAGIFLSCFWGRNFSFPKIRPKKTQNCVCL